MGIKILWRLAAETSFAIYLFILALCVSFGWKQLQHFDHLKVRGVKSNQ